MNTQSGAVAPGRDNSGLDLIVGQVSVVLDKCDKDKEKNVVAMSSSWEGSRDDKS